jgi:hypothetical protein
MKKLSIIYLGVITFGVISFSSCLIHKRVKVPNVYKEQAVYKLNDVLVYRFNKNEILDTFILSNITRAGLSGQEELTFKIYNEPRYWFAAVKNGKCGRPTILLYINSRNNGSRYQLKFNKSFAYRMNKFNPFAFSDLEYEELNKGICMDSLKLKQSVEMVVNGRNYTDVVKVLNTEKVSMYWSLSNGIIKYNLTDTIQYELVNKYNDKAYCKMIKKKLSY